MKRFKEYTQDSVNEVKFTRLPKQLNAMWNLKNSVESMVSKHDNGDDYDPKQMRTIEEFIKEIKKSAKDFKSKEEVSGTVYESVNEAKSAQETIINSLKLYFQTFFEAGVGSDYKMFEKFWKKYYKDLVNVAGKINVNIGGSVDEFKNLPEKLDTLKWLKELYDDAINEAEKAEGDRSKLSAEIEKALKDKATESGVPIGLLRLVMRRGLDAWNSSHREGVPQVAWGYARVNAFLEKGKGTWGKADADIAKEVRDESKAGKLPIKNPSEFTKKEREA